MSDIIELLKLKKNKDIEKLKKLLKENEDDLELINTKAKRSETLEMRYKLFFDLNKKLKLLEAKSLDEKKTQYNNDLKIFDSYFGIDRNDILKQKNYCFSDIYFQ